MNGFLKILVAMCSVFIFIGCGTSGEVKNKESVIASGAGSGAAPTGAKTSSADTGSAVTSSADTSSAVTSSRLDNAPAAADDTAMAAALTASAPVTGGDATPPSAVGGNDDDSLLSVRTIYFAFDSAQLTDDATPVLKAHGAYLAKNVSAKFTLEGHCDERGTREYNMALGELRANAVRKALLVNGASNDQIRTISYGEERPVKMGHDESAWQYNRRAEVVYTSN